MYVDTFFAKHNTYLFEIFIAKPKERMDFPIIIICVSPLSFVGGGEGGGGGFRCDFKILFQFSMKFL